MSHDEQAMGVAHVRKSRVTANTLANFAGSFSSAFLALIFVPIYLHYLGIEAYGLIGVSTTVAVILTLSDFGIAAALTREMARDWEGAQDICEGRRALTTLTTIYLPLATVLGALVIIGAPYIATNWVADSNLPQTTIENVVQLIGLTSIFLLISSYYSAGLAGLQHQVLVNLISMLSAIVQAGGAVLVLKYLSADIIAFFAWQAAIVGIQAIVVAAALYKLVPGGRDCRKFDRQLLRKMAGFGLSVSGISLLSIALTQTDKVVMSRLLNLHDFGVYSLAIAVAMSLRRMFGPLFASVYPRLTELVRREDGASIERLYHLSSQAMSVTVLPAAMILMIFAREVIYVWTGDSAISQAVHLPLVLMVAGMALTGLTQLPYAMQLAHGWTKLPLMTNLISVVFFIPGTYFLGTQFGGAGAAAAWLALNLVYFLIQVPIMHSRILPQALRRWYLFDIAVPATAAALPVLAARPFLDMIGSQRLLLGVCIVAIYLLSLLATLLGTGDLRNAVWRQAKLFAVAIKGVTVLRN